MKYLGYCTSGREFEVEKHLQDDGFDVWCGRAVIFAKKGKRRPWVEDWQIVPAIPNYLFLNMEADDWHRLHSRPRKYLARTMRILRRDDERDLPAFKRACESRFEEGMRIVRRKDRTAMCQFIAGQKVEATTEGWEGRFGTFRRLVEESGALMAEVEMEMFGGYAPVRFPLVDVKAET